MKSTVLLAIILYCIHGLVWAIQDGLGAPRTRRLSAFERQKKINIQIQDFTEQTRVSGKSYISSPSSNKISIKTWPMSKDKRTSHIMNVEKKNKT